MIIIKNTTIDCKGWDSGWCFWRYKKFECSPPVFRSQRIWFSLLCNIIIEFGFWFAYHRTGFVPQFFKFGDFSSFPQYFQNISNFKSPITYIFVKCGCSNYFSLNSANLLCRGTDISNYFRESLWIRDNESRLYFCFHHTIEVRAFFTMIAERIIWIFSSFRIWELIIFTLKSVCDLI